LALADSQSVVLWNTATRRKVKQIQVKPGVQLISFGISADARMLAMGYTDDTITLHDCRSGELLDTISSHLSGVEWIAFSPDGKTLATASGRLIKLWNVPTRREMFSLDLPSIVIYVAFTPDGNGLLTAEKSGVTHLWRAPQMEAIPPPQQAKAE
jgi:WD40 repeat protein